MADNEAPESIAACSEDEDDIFWQQELIEHSRVMPSWAMGCGYTDDQEQKPTTDTTTYPPQQQGDIVKRFSQAMLKSLTHGGMKYVAVNHHWRQHILPHISEAVKEFTETVDADESASAQMTRALAKMIHVRRFKIATQFHDLISRVGLETDTESGYIDIGDGAPMASMDKPTSPALIAPPSSTETSLDTFVTQALPQHITRLMPSCTQCRRRKQKCSKGRPCTNCLRRVPQTICEYKGKFTNRWSVKGEDDFKALIDRPEFKRLITTVEHLIMQYCGEKMPFIRYKTGLALSSYRHQEQKDTLLQADFNVDWNLASFLINNYEAGIHQKLDKIVAITGSIDTAQLCSVSQYFKRWWPEQSSQLLEALEHQICHSSSGESPPTRFSFDLPRSNTITIDPSLRAIRVSGTENFIASIAQQLAWLAAACQEKKDTLSYAYVGFAVISQSNDCQVPVFDIDVKLETLPETGNTGSCWNSVIGPAVVITGFPLPDRNSHERGLETSVPVMAQLLGLPKAVTFKGGFVFKGRYTALVPVKDLGPSIQWHIVDMYPLKLEWDYIDKLCPDRVVGDLLLDSRSFFGWCPKILEWLATAWYNYESIQYSGACAPSRWAQIDKFQLGFSQWGTVTAEVTLGRKDGYRCQRPDDYETVLEDARSMHIILYDTTHRRATQTNAEDLILHILLHQRNKKNQEGHVNPSHQVNDLEFANPDRRVTPTRTVMVNNAERVFCHRRQFVSSEPQKSLFKNEAKSLYTTIDGLWAQDYVNQKSNSFKMSLDPRPLVHGWEYMDLVTSTRWMPPKSVKMKSTCGRWNEYVRDIRALVFFGANFGDILTPASPRAVCPVFSSVPSDRFFLGIRVDDMERLFTLQGSLKDQAKVSASGLALSGSTDLFNVHEQVEDGQCGPQRLVRFITPGILGGKKCLLPLETDGAIIIGELEDKVLHQPCRQEGDKTTLNQLKQKAIHPNSACGTVHLPAASVPITYRQESQGAGILTASSAAKE
ncbi:alcohol dehydrogenase [Fusarium albosuccineum]|uniref:Alcohol dehydrogenase n=1 Tax=Fusarium albosuccineum TaxID=1237068 RepID=A0A8H4KVI2_9HYPO|nr:alcohol dehydrogenase [Fusarium albosuccineum]